MALRGCAALFQKKRGAHTERRDRDRRGGSQRGGPLGVSVRSPIHFSASRGGGWTAYGACVERIYEGNPVEAVDSRAGILVRLVRISPPDPSVRLGIRALTFDPQRFACRQLSARSKRRGWWRPCERRIST